MSELIKMNKLMNQFIVEFINNKTCRVCRSSNQGKEMFNLETHSTLFIYSYMASDSSNCFYPCCFYY